MYNALSNWLQVITCQGNKTSFSMPLSFFIIPPPFGSNANFYSMRIRNLGDEHTNYRISSITTILILFMSEKYDHRKKPVIIHYSVCYHLLIGIISNLLHERLADKKFNSPRKTSSSCNNCIEWSPISIIFVLDTFGRYYR